MSNNTNTPEALESSQHLDAQEQQVSEVWNQQDPVQIARDLNALMMQMLDEETPL